MIIIQDESIFKSYDASKKIWKLETGGGIRKKGEGTGIMISVFLTEESGFLSFSEEEFAEFVQMRRASRKPEPKYFSKHDNRYFVSIHMFEYGKDRQGYWNGDLMLEQTDEFIDALEFKFPSYQFCFYSIGVLAMPSTPKTCQMYMP